MTWHLFIPKICLPKYKFRVILPKIQKLYLYVSQRQEEIGKYGQKWAKIANFGFYHGKLIRGEHFLCVRLDYDFLGLDMHGNTKL